MLPGEERHPHRSSSPASRSPTRSPTRQSGRSRIAMTPKSTRQSISSSRHGFTDDSLASSYRTSTPNSRSSSRRLVTRADGRVAQRSSRDQIAHEANSRDRRASVRDALFKSLGEEDDQDDFDFSSAKPKSARGGSLSGFLDGNKQKMGKKGASDGSVKSAPISSDEHRRRSQSHKSRRWNNRMLLPPSGRDTGANKRSGEADSGELNIAQQGYIEVQDGKMRLVFDVET